MDILISGASSGIGRATAVHFARLGHTVWAGVRSKKDFDNITRLNVKGLRAIQLDVTDSESIHAAVNLIKKESGMLHVLINNAGIVVAGPIEGLSLAKWREQFEVNFFGLIELTKACLPSIREAKGRIINMSSISGKISSPYLGPYGSSKFALEAFSDSLRREVERYGVRVCVIEPGPIQTPIWRKSVVTNQSQISQYPKEIMELYGRSLEKFLGAMTKAETNATPVAAVVKAVEHAIFARIPKTRYTVGRGIGLMSLSSRVLPDRWVDQLIRSRS